MNATDLGEIKVYRGKKNYRDLGQVVTIDGETGSKKVQLTFFVYHSIYFEIQFNPFNLKFRSKCMG